MGLQRGQRPAGHLPRTTSGPPAGVFSVGDRFAFDNPQSAEAFEYLVRLINTDHVAPPASDTNDNGDFSRNQFLQGRMALFQSGTYNLAAVADQAPFRWGVAMLPVGTEGPGQRDQRHCRRGQFGHQASRRGAAGAGLDGQPPGNEYLGARGAAIPAVLAAQPVYYEYWASRGVDVEPVLQGAQRPAHPRARRCRDSPRDSRPSSRTSTRCSSAAATWPTSLADAQAGGELPRGRALTGAQQRELEGQCAAAHRRDDRQRHPVPHFRPRRRRRDLTGTTACGDRVAHLVGPPQRHGDGRGNRSMTSRAHRRAVPAAW